MRRASLIAAIAALAGLGLASSAQAEWYFTNSGAEKIERRRLNYELGYYITRASCRPQGASKADPRFKYHRWVCVWAASGANRSDPIYCGTDLIIGTRAVGRYYRQALRGTRECG
jgi:hypothetical protein